MTNLEAIITGAIGSLLALLGTRVLVWLRIDDPVGASTVHGVAGLWSMVAVGLFAQNDNLEGYSKVDNFYKLIKLLDHHKKLLQK